MQNPCLPEWVTNHRIVRRVRVLARLLSVVSTKTDIVVCSGCPVDLLRTIDQSHYFTRGVQSCFRFEQVDLLRLMHKLNYSVFGQIDFFSVFRGLVISLGRSLTTDWIQRSPELTRVSNLLDILHLARF